MPSEHGPRRRPAHRDRARHRHGAADHHGALRGDLRDAAGLDRGRPRQRARRRLRRRAGLPGPRQRGRELHPVRQPRLDVQRLERARCKLPPHRRTPPSPCPAGRRLGAGARQRRAGEVPLRGRHTRSTRRRGVVRLRVDRSRRPTRPHRAGEPPGPAASSTTSTSPTTRSRTRRSPASPPSCVSPRLGGPGVQPAPTPSQFAHERPHLRPRPLERHDRDLRHAVRRRRRRRRTRRPASTRRRPAARRKFGPADITRAATLPMPSTNSAMKAETRSTSNNPGMPLHGADAGHLQRRRHDDRGLAVDEVHEHHRDRPARTPSTCGSLAALHSGAGATVPQLDATCSTCRTCRRDPPTRTTAAPTACRRAASPASAADGSTDARRTRTASAGARRGSTRSATRPRRGAGDGLVTELRRPDAVGHHDAGLRLPQRRPVTSPGSVTSQTTAAQRELRLRHGRHHLQGQERRTCSGSSGRTPWSSGTRCRLGATSLLARRQPRDRRRDPLRRPHLPGAELRHGRHRARRAHGVRLDRAEVPRPGRSDDHDRGASHRVREELRRTTRCCVRSSPPKFLEPVATSFIAHPVRVRADRLRRRREPRSDPRPDPRSSAVFGLLIGSFLNVVAYRVPIGMSIVSPPSACPGCGIADLGARQRAAAVLGAAPRRAAGTAGCRSPPGTRSSRLITGIAFGVAALAVPAAGHDARGARAS